MKILLIHNYYKQRGGEDAVFEEEIKLLREDGYIVEVIVFNNDNFNNNLYNGLRFSIKSLYNNASANIVDNAIKNFKPDIIHIHNIFYAATPSIIKAAKRRNIPIVMTLHNYRLVCNSGMLSRIDQVPCERCLKKVLPLDGIRYKCFRNSSLQSAQLTAITSVHKLTGIWKEVDKFIVLTDFAREKFLQSSLELRPEQVVVKPNFVTELGIDENVKRQDFFLYVGRLSYEKGVEALIRSAYLHKIPIEIIGDGPMRPLVEKAAQELKHIHYLGPLPRHNVIARMRLCRAVIVPSICYEGLPTTILEAYSTGTPVLCSNQSNLNSIVIHKHSGLLFETNNPSSIVKAMKQLTNVECVKYAEEGLKLYKAKYKKEAILSRTRFIYQSILQKND